MMGAEGEPDWSVFEGQFELKGATNYRIRNKEGEYYSGEERQAPSGSTFAASVEEKQRVAAHTVPTEKRFHYRYYAAELMWQCAQLLPDNDELTAAALYKGGTFLMKRDPKAADRFYKALVRRCSSLPIGRQAETLHWFPSQTPKP